MVIVVQIFLLMILTGLAIMLVDGNRFHTVSYEVESVKLQKSHCFVVIADLHNKTYGKNHEKLLKRIEKEEPEGILIAGDVLTAKPGYPLEPAIELIRQLTERYPVYYGMGNHETRLFLYPEVYGDMGKQYENQLSSFGVSLLKNKTIQLEDNMLITGLDMERRFYQRFRKTPMEEEYLENTLGKKEKEKFQILLAHNPDYFPEYSLWGADLVLSGHVHGGMVRIPFLGGIVSPAFRFFPRYDGGKFKENNSYMILSRGLGMHTIPMRIFNPGELVVIHLRPTGE